MNWHTEGLGGEATGEGLGFSGEKGKIGRNVVMRVVNNHLRFDGQCIFTDALRNAHIINSQLHIIRSN
jgi:hypothetical protein